MNTRRGVRQLALALVAVIGLVCSAASASTTVSFSDALTDDASTGIDSSKTYTHAISGGSSPGSINGVPFNLLNSGTTPANFSWTTPQSKNQIVSNQGDWNPANGGVTGPGLTSLLNGFTFSGTGANPGSSQTFTLSGLDPGKTYDARLYIRVWDDNLALTGRPIELTFTNGSASQMFLEDRPTAEGYANDDVAYFINARYVAGPGGTLIIDAEVPADGFGSFHLYGLTNEVAVPEPATAALGLLGLGALGMVARRRRGALAVLAALVLVGASHSPVDAAQIPGIFNTGVDDFNNVLPNSPTAIDPHYAIIVNPDGGGPGAHVEDETVFPIAGPWLNNTPTSKWIAPRFNTQSAFGAAGAAGDYVYRLTFDLTGLDPSTAVLTGDWATDNAGLDILLNGVPTGNANATQFGSFTAFSIPAGSPFVAGVNTLDFQLNNSAVGYTGLHVQFTTATADVLVPEPATAALGLLGLGALGAGLRRRRA